ncbi:ferrous iron transport protein A [Candidatus Omnitrophota bacterium]
MTKNNVPLSSISAQRKVKIIALNGGNVFQSRITSLGLHVGSYITIVRHAKRGPLLVEAKGTRIALGHGMAQKIIVMDTDKRKISPSSKKAEK